jgi:PleD family two-component response regulator
MPGVLLSEKRLDHPCRSGYRSEIKPSAAAIDKARRNQTASIRKELTGGMTDTLLIADGSEASAHRTRKILADLGYDARTALSASEALQVCQQLSPAVLLASNRLPDMDTREWPRPF